MATPYDQIPQQGQPPQPGMGQPQQPPMQGGDPTQQQPQPQPAPQADDPTARLNSLIEAAITSKNQIANWKDDDERLTKLSTFVTEGFETDIQSCRGWLDSNKEWLRLALLLRENKVYPWTGASNVKYPLLSTAAMQFSARAYPTLVPADNQIVKSRVVGYDPDGSRLDRADRIAKHMSYQIMYKIPNWEENMDRLLNLTSIVGVVFKKTYRDDDKGVVCSKLVYPEDLIINYGATSIEEAYRKTEVLRYTPKVYKEKVAAGFFRDIGDIGLAAIPVNVPAHDRPSANDNDRPSHSDESTPHIFLSMHTFYDIDEDGYPEPVEIVIHQGTQKVVRVVARFSLDDVQMNDTGKKIVKITPIEYFTDFPFLPNPDGSIYGLGFGTLLGPINEAINSLINQLVDAGTLNNMQTGFIGKGLRLQMKEEKLRPGEWRAVNATGDDLKKSIFPIPSKEPSAVLFQLMNMLVQSGNQLASVAEIFVGKMPGQNTPATTTQETVDQAMKVFTAIYKRIYRALLKEFQKIYRINRLSPDMVAQESKVLNIPLTASDYDGEDDDIIPAADPSGSSGTMQQQALAQIGQTLIPMGIINPQEFALRTLKLINIPDPEKLINPPQPPPPDPKAELEKEKQNTEKLKQQGMQADQQGKAQAQQQDATAKQQELDTRARMLALEQSHKQFTTSMEVMNQKQDQHAKAIASNMELMHTALTDHLDKLRQANNLAHEVQMNKIKQQQAKKPKPNANKS